MKLEYLQNILREKKIKIFTSREFRLLLGMTVAGAQRLLWRYEKKGIIVKLKRGLYALNRDYPPLYLVGNRLYMPSYISFDTAMSYHGLIPETIYSITSATAKTTRQFVVKGIAYNYHRIKTAAYTGYRPIKEDGQTILMAEPEKALADYLYYVALNQRGLHYERLDLRKINKKKLIKYINLFGQAKLGELVDRIYDEFRKPKRIY